MKKTVAILILVSLLAGIPMNGMAEATGLEAPEYQVFLEQASDSIITLDYAYTYSVTATLSFSNGKANCSGSVTPSGTDSVSVTVTLYQKNGSSWNTVTSWSGSSTNGHQAAAGGSISVEDGTYKVKTAGNVGNGKEKPTKSVTRTK